MVVAAPGSHPVEHVSMNDRPADEERSPAAFMGGLLFNMGKGCVYSAGGLLMIGGSLSLMTAGLFALPTAGASAVACVGGMVGGAIEYSVTGEVSPVSSAGDIEDGLLKD